MRQSPSYSLTIRLSYPDEPGRLGGITSAIGAVDGMIGAVDMVDATQRVMTRDITVCARDAEHGRRIVGALHAMPGVTVVRALDRTFQLHHGGKISVRARTRIKTRDDLSMVYTPGVARVCQAIHADPRQAFALTIRRTTVAVVTDGSAVLGLGDLGPRAALPVMEGKAVLFREFGGINAFPICLDTQDPEKIIAAVMHMAPTFGGINLEDISSPRCVAIEERLEAALDIPVFHDDQHGTAVVVLAGLINALTLVGKTLDACRIVICGAGAAGYAIARLLATEGAGDIVVCDRAGAISSRRAFPDNPVKQWIAGHTNRGCREGPLGEVIADADIFIGVSQGGVLARADVARMAGGAIVFALANPDPEMDPDEAASCAAVVAVGRSDYPNQINNVLCFPGFFRGMLDVRARRVTHGMKCAAARAIAHMIPEADLTPDHIIPSVFNRGVAAAVAQAVAACALAEGVAEGEVQPGAPMG